MGYNLYVDGVLYYDGSHVATVNEYTITSLSVGVTYAISVTSVNVIGESAKNTLNLLAAAPPSKMSKPTLQSATSNSITIEYTDPSFDGGDTITNYAIRRDDGPLTTW